MKCTEQTTIAYFLPIALNHFTAKTFPVTPHHVIQPSLYIYIYSESGVSLFVIIYFFKVVPVRAMPVCSSIIIHNSSSN